MKKIILILAIFILMVSACNNQSSETSMESDSTTTTVVQVTTTTTLAIETTSTTIQDITTTTNPESVVSTTIVQETLEVGGTVNEWKDILAENTGADSEASKGLVECDTSMADLVETCSQNTGWMVDNIMEIVDLSTDQRYEYQDVERGGCDEDVDSTKNIDSQFVDATSGDYQVLCSVNCYSWDCDEESLTGSYSGPYDLTGDISFFCPSMPTLTHSGLLTADLVETDGVVTGSGTVHDLSSIELDGTGGCTVVGGPSYDGTVTGTRTGVDVELTINFGDPDLFMNELTITGTYVDGKILGEWTGIDGSGSVDIDRIN